MSVPVIWYKPFHKTHVTYSCEGKRKRLSAGCGRLGPCPGKPEACVGTEGCIGISVEVVGGYVFVSESPLVLVDESATLEADPLVSHLEGAVARKNLSLSKCARRSCSKGFKGRVSPPERPGVDVV